jgi:Na+-translocating ferredoxin:NAD+ oxidoreductase RnfG subunit
MMAEETRQEKQEAEEKKVEVPVKSGMPDWLRFPLVLAVVCAVSAVGLAGMYALTKKKMEDSNRRKVTGAFEEILGEAYSEEETEEVKLDGKGALLKRFAVRDAEGNLTAQAGVVKCPGSYNASEPIQLVVVLGPELERVLGIRVAASKETPGLGERIKESPSALSIVGWMAGRPGRERVVTKGEGALVGTVEEKKDGSVVFIDSEGKRREFGKGDVVVTQPPFPPAFLDQFTGVPVASAKLASDGGAVDAITGATVSSRAVVKGVGLAVEELRAATEE